MSEKQTTNKPTTVEIVRALREEAKLELGGQAATIHLTTIQNAIDRIESQEQKIAEIENFHKEMLKDHKTQVAALTARAEKAERERDAAVAKTKSGCFTPMTETFDGIQIDDGRGLPQDGEGA